MTEVFFEDVVGPLSLLNRMMKEGYVRASYHPDNQYLTVWNYTPKAQYEQVWNDVTLNCRGLITMYNRVMSRPFPKFFNLAEMDETPTGAYTVKPKFDGSLGIAYLHPDGHPAISTRGSFTSDQALWATRWLRDRGAERQWVLQRLHEGQTPLFEIIYPENRVVVDYHGLEALVYLTTLDNATALDVVSDHRWPGIGAKNLLGEIGGLLSDPIPNAEGYVLTWRDGTRAKLKFDEYVRLHKLLTGVNERTIWQALSSGTPSIEKLVEHVPDEFYHWVHAAVDRLKDAYTQIEMEARDEFSRIPMDVDRRTQAGIILKSPLKSILFAMLDGKDYSQTIWKMIKPEPTPAFFNRSEDEA